MTSQSWIKPVAGAALICAGLVTLCILYVDRPVERLVVNWILLNPNSGHAVLMFDAMAAPSLLPVPCAIVYLLFHTFRRLSGHPAGARAALYLSLSIATAVGTLAKEELKEVIGRPWPATWWRYGVYKISPFTMDNLYGGFPSGHTTYIAAPMFVLWWAMPAYRPLWLAVIVAVMIGLVGSGHHFVGDVIAGFFLGMAAAAGTLAVGPKVSKQPLF